jgi:hypothetical protein
LRRYGFRSRRRRGKSIEGSLGSETDFFDSEGALVKFGVGLYAAVLQPSPVNTTGVPKPDLIGWL